ncbi:MAG: hypothetical protein HY209_07495 [Candidatus Omnitrophica bacterium]|nr:hypothetical protein [Candidatus Omnitrophota bacterium]
MDIFGLTSIDTALATWGLNSAQKLTVFLFIQTPAGIAAFATGFLWSLWQSVQESNFKYFAVFIFISLTGILLLITPQRPEPAIKSAMEAYGTNSGITAKSLKDSQTNEHRMPVVLSFIGQMFDAMNIGAISIFDSTLTGNTRFLSNPFGLQKISLQANYIVNSSIADVRLKEDLDDFIYAHYLPSLMMYKNDASSLSDFYSLWPGHTKILGYYSSNERSQWDDLKSRLTRLINDPQGPWPKIKNILKQMNTQNDNLDDQIMASIIQGQSHHSTGRWWLYWTGWVQTFFPYIYGAGNFCLYAGFPMLMLAMMIMRRMSLFLRYAEMFIWIKSWALTAAMSYYISLMVAGLQAQTSSQANWFWDYPYYVVVASILLCLIPILTLVSIHYSFQLINNHSFT